jgi:hypothetical protein
MIRQPKKPVGAKRKPKKPAKQLSLHPLSLETALFAALQTGPGPKRKRKKPVDKNSSERGGDDS